MMKMNLISLHFQILSFPQVYLKFAMTFIWPAHVLYLGNRSNSYYACGKPGRSITSTQRLAVPWEPVSGYFCLEEE